MRTWILLLLLVCASAWSGDDGLPLVGVQARGFIIDDVVDTVYFEHLLDAESEDSAFVVGASQKAGRRQVTMLFKPETAEQIAREVEPYLTLFERGRKFSEDIKINNTITISLTSRNNMQMTIRNTSEKSELQYRGNKLLTLIKGWSNAVEVSRTWLATKLGTYLPPTSIDNWSGPEAFTAPEFDPFELEEEDDVVDLTQLASEYAVNEYSAEAKYRQYLNQPLTVSGTVKTVTRDARTDKPRIFFAQSIGSNPVTCLLDDISDDEVATIQPGETLTVSGRWMGKTEGIESNLVGGRVVW